MSGLVWEEPPPMERPRRDWTAIATGLRERPSQWAIVAEFGRRSSAAMMAIRIGCGFFAPLRPAGTFEGVPRRRGDGWAVYARYVGDSKPADGAS